MITDHRVHCTRLQEGTTASSILDRTPSIRSWFNSSVSVDAWRLESSIQLLYARHLYLSSAVACPGTRLEMLFYSVLRKVLLLSISFQHLYYYFAFYSILLLFSVPSKIWMEMQITINTQTSMKAVKLYATHCTLYMYTHPYGSSVYNKSA